MAALSRSPFLAALHLSRVQGFTAEVSCLEAHGGRSHKLPVSGCRRGPCAQLGLRCGFAGGLHSAMSNRDVPGRAEDHF